MNMISNQTTSCPPSRQLIWPVETSAKKVPVVFAKTAATRETVVPIQQAVPRELSAVGSGSLPKPPLRCPCAAGASTNRQTPPFKAALQTNTSDDNRTLNSFAASFTVAMVLFAGFVVAATGVTLTSVALAVTGFLVMLGGHGLYGLLLV